MNSKPRTPKLVDPQSAIGNRQSDPLRILILEDVPTDAELVERAVRDAGITFTSRVVDTRDDFVKQLEDFSPDLVLSDYSMPQFTGMDALELVKERYPSIPLIIVTGSLNEETAVECMKAGAADYMLKDNLTRFGPAVKGALEKKQLRAEKERAEKEIRRMGEEWMLTFDSITDWVSIQDKDFKIVRANRAYADKFNMKPEELIGKPCYEVVHGTKEPWPSCPHRQTLETKKPATEEFFEPRLGIYLEITCSSIFNENGEATSTVHITKDITERKQSEEALRESEKKFRGLFESSKDAIFIADLKTRKLVECNKQAKKLTGYSRKEILSMRADQLHPKDKVKKTMEAFKKHAAGELLFVESEVLTKDKKRVPVSINSSPYEIAGKKYVQSTFRDITERVQAEKKIKEYSENLERMVEDRTKELNRAVYDTEASRDRIDGILKSIGDGLIVTDLYNRIILMNRVAEDLLGVYLTEVINRPIDFAIHDKILRERIKTTLDKKKEGYEFDFELPGKDAEHALIMRARTSVIEDKAGKQTGIITIFHDITCEGEVN